jgi:hypothetical protein
MAGSRAQRVRVGVAVLTIAESGILVTAGWIAWSFRYLMVGPGSPQAADRTRFAVAIFVAAVVNVAILITFLRNSRRWKPIFVAVQTADALATAVMGFLISWSWWLVTIVAIAVIALLYLARNAMRPVER